MRVRSIPTVTAILALLLTAMPASANEAPVVADGCADEVDGGAVPSWDLDSVDVNGVYELEADELVLRGLEVVFTLCGDVADRPATSGYLFNWTVQDQECRQRLHVSDGPDEGLTGYLQQICPDSAIVAGAGLSHLVLSERIPATRTIVDGRAITVTLPLDEELAGLDPAAAEGAVWTATTGSAGPGLVAQDGDSLDDSTVASYPYTPMDSGQGRDVVIGEDRP